MPVSDEGAALQFFVEAMKANTAVLKGLQEEQKETLRIVHDTRERVIRLESSRLNGEIEELKKEVDDLKEDKFQRDGASKLAANTLRNGPTVVFCLAVLVLVVVILAANGKIVL